MTTLRDLEYAVSTNTDGLAKALPAIDKLVKTLDSLSKSVQQLADNYENQINRVAKAQMGAAASATKSANVQQLAIRKQNDALKEAKKRVTDLNNSLRGANLTSFMGGNIQSLKAFERAMKSGAMSAYDFSQAKKKLNATIANSNAALKTYNVGVVTAASNTVKAAGAMLKQENALERSKQKYLDLQAVLAKMKTPEGLAKSGALTAAFQTLETAMKSGPQTAQNFSRAQNAFNSVLNDTKRSLKENHPILGALGLDMEDLTKATQIALGPLSGVASRISAMTTLAKTNTLAIAGLISGVVAFAVGLTAAISAGAAWEQEMNAINAVLKITGNRMGITADEIDSITDAVEQATSASDNTARKATLEFLTLQNVTKDLLKPALMAAQGLSLIGRGDMVSQMRRLGKVLEDPMNNLKGLTESGVQFNAVEQMKIRSLQLSGRLHEAQTAVLKKLTTVQAAAQGQSEGLNGAWHRMAATLNNLFEESSEGTGVLTSLASGVDEITNSIKKFNDDAGAARDIGMGFHAMIATLVTIVELVVGHLRLFAAALIALTVLKIAQWVSILSVALVKYGKTINVVTKGTQAGTKLMAASWSLFAIAATLMLQRLIDKQAVTVESTSRLADENDADFKRMAKSYDDYINGVTTSRKVLDKLGNIIFFASPTIQEKRLVGIHNKIQDFIEGIAQELNTGLPKFIGIPGVDPHAVQALQNQVKRIKAALKAQLVENEDAARQGRAPIGVDMSKLKQIEDAFKSLSDAPSPENFDKFRKTVMDTNSTFAPMLAHLAKTNDVLATLPENLQAAGSDFIELRNKFANFIQEESDASDSIENLTLHLSAMQRAMIEEGNPEAAKTIGFVTQLAINGATAIRKLTTDLINEGSAMKRTAQINASTGKAFDDLTLQQETMANILQAIPNLTEDMVKNFDKLPESIQKQIEAIKGATKALHEYSIEADKAARTKAISQQIDISLQGLADAAKSDAEREASAKRLEVLQELMNTSLGKDVEFVKKILAATDAISQIDQAAQQKALVAGLQDQLQVAQRSYQLAGTSAAVRDEETQALQDQVEQMRRLGELDQTELNIKKQIRDLERAADLANELHLQQQQITVMEKEVSLAGLSAGARAEEVAKLQDMVDLYERYGTVSEEDLKNRELIRSLQKDIDHNNAMQDLQHQLDIQNKIASTYFMTEDAQRSILAMEEMKYQLTQKYGSLQDKNAQAELAAFQAVQDRVEWIRNNLKPLKDAFDGLFSHIEDGMVEFLSNGRLDVIAWARSLAEDVFRIMWKNLVTEPLTNAVGGMLSKMIPNSPSVGNLTALGTFANPMFVKVIGGLPGTGLGFGQGAASTLPIPTSGANSLAGQFSTALKTYDPLSSIRSSGDPFGLGGLRGTLPGQDVPSLPDFTSIFGGAGTMNNMPINGMGISNNPGFMSAMTGGSIQDQMWSFFKSKGLSDAQVSGIMGNVQVESGFNPGAVGDSGNALGLFQWNDRGPAMQAAVPDWATNPQGQMQFAWQEMMGSENRSYNRLLGTSDPGSASNAFMGFERPRGFGTAAGVPSAGERSGAAQGFYNQYAGTQGQYGMGQWDQMGGAAGDWGMSYTGTGISGQGGGFDAINQLTESTNALKTAQDSAATAAGSMSTGVTQATTAATQLGQQALPATTQAMTNMASTGVQQATTGMLATGTASVTSAASIQALGSASLSAAAQMAATSGAAGLFHAGGMSNSPISGFRGIDIGGFSGPRLAKGLLPNEFRAVLHRNEAVFNEDQLQALSGALSRKNRANMNENDDGTPDTASGGVNFHFHGVKDMDTFRKSGPQMAAFVAKSLRKADLRGN